MTLPIAKEWEKILSVLKASIKLMKEKPELNHNSTTASYGMAAKIPDKSVLNDFANIFTGLVLDTL